MVNVVDLQSLNYDMCNIVEEDKKKELKDPTSIKVEDFSHLFLVLYDPVTEDFYKLPAKTF